MHIFRRIRWSFRFLTQRPLHNYLLKSSCTCTLSSGRKLWQLWTYYSSFRLLHSTEQWMTLNSVGSEYLWVEFPDTVHFIIPSRSKMRRMPWFKTSAVLLIFCSEIYSQLHIYFCQSSSLFFCVRCKLLDHFQTL